MPQVIYQHRIYRSDLVENRECFYVFGDNLRREGLGGQAGEMRGEPNAIGVATKHAPGMDDDDFWTHQEIVDLVYLDTGVDWSQFPRPCRSDQNNAIRVGKGSRKPAC